MKRRWAIGSLTSSLRSVRSSKSTTSLRILTAMRSSGRRSEVTSTCGKSFRLTTISQRPIKQYRRRSHRWKARRLQFLPQEMRMTTGATLQWLKVIRARVKVMLSTAYIRLWVLLGVVMVQLLQWLMAKTTIRHGVSIIVQSVLGAFSEGSLIQRSRTSQSKSLTVWQQ